MIRARLNNGTFLFGIDAENVRRLKAGKPITVDIGMIGGTDKFILVYGDTMADIVAELERVQGHPLPPAQPVPKMDTEH